MRSAPAACRGCSGSGAVPDAGVFPRFLVGRSGTGQAGGQRDGPAGNGLLQLGQQFTGVKRRGRARGGVHGIHQGVHGVHHHQKQVHQLVRHRKLALPGPIEQRFRLVGQAVQFLVIDDAAIALQVVEKAEQVVDQFLIPRGVAFQLQKSGVDIFSVFTRFVDKILKMPLAEGRQGDGFLARQRGDPIAG